MRWFALALLALAVTAPAAFSQSQAGTTGEAPDVISLYLYHAKTGQTDACPSGQGGELVIQAPTDGGWCGADQPTGGTSSHPFVFAVSGYDDLLILTPSMDVSLLLANGLRQGPLPDTTVDFVIKVGTEEVAAAKGVDCSNTTPEAKTCSFQAKGTNLTWDPRDSVNGKPLSVTVKLTGSVTAYVQAAGKSSFKVTHTLRPLETYAPPTEEEKGLLPGVPALVVMGSLLLAVLLRRRM